MKPEPKPRIERPEPGVLIYRGSDADYCFPVYDEAGETIFVACPTRQRRRSWLRSGGWEMTPPELSQRELTRIAAEVQNHFRHLGVRVRVQNRTEGDQSHFQFHPELFECKGKATEALDAAGYVWFTDYTTIDLLHEDIGLEVCGIREQANVKGIACVMATAFPHWHCSYVCHHDRERDPGWKVAFCLFPPRRGGGRSVDAD